MGAEIRGAVHVHIIQPAIWDYAWGSSTEIQEIVGCDDPRIAEAWFGAHPLAPSSGPDGRSLDQFVSDDPRHALGEGTVRRFGGVLPYLLKIIAADGALSLQVHPRLEAARAGFAAEEAAGIPRDAPRRNYRDPNHKPELVYALTRFEAMCGFRTPRRAAEVLSGLGTSLSDALSSTLRDEPSAKGVREVFTRLVTPEQAPAPDDVAQLVEACRLRLESGSPSPRADRTVVMLAAQFPGDPGVVTSLLLNPVTLRPGEALFIPAGGVHSYLHGLAVEVMASSDNVLRAGLTGKHVDVPEMLRNVDYVAAPPIRIAPEAFHQATRVYYAPVDDFELSVTDVPADGVVRRLPGLGPRVVLCLDGSVVLEANNQTEVLPRGRAAFVADGDGPVTVGGKGTVVQAAVP
ncbi:MAG: mannose-6-phosphate isomerase, class I [Micrococcales bacterium]|nr:mannose-6-phosphate isomerase, class I [Micrococcales bacterium]MCL2668919.1 mannose-6-phosphate isomerase, class I [Micrococcales bacterium]